MSESLNEDEKKFLNTIFPKDFDPTTKKMIRVDKGSIDFKW